MLDVGLVSQALLEHASATLNHLLLRHLHGSPVEKIKWIAFIVALHDLGKISPGFQAKRPDLIKLLSTEFAFSVHGDEPDHGRVTLNTLPDLFESMNLCSRYLTDWQHRFNLFAPDYPFYQTAHFTTRSAPISIRKLFHELATANNKTLFDHSVDKIPLYLTPNLAARALLTFQMYSLGGGNGTTSEQFGKHPNLAHAPLISGVVVLVQGQNLFETLLLNLMVYKQDNPIPRSDETEDLPVWEQVTYLKLTSVGRTPNGYLDYLTWRSRHLRLLPTPTGNVAQLYLAQADALANAVRDPRFAYKINADKEKFPVKLSIERAFWRDSGSLFAFSEEYRPLVFKQLAELEEQGYLSPGGNV